jgi:hypothetical protein
VADEGHNKDDVINEETKERHLRVRHPSP